MKNRSRRSTNNNRWHEASYWKYFKILIYFSFSAWANFLIFRFVSHETFFLLHASHRKVFHAANGDVVRDYQTTIIFIIILMKYWCTNQCYGIYLHVGEHRFLPETHFFFRYVEMTFRSFEIFSISAWKFAHFNTIFTLIILHFRLRLLQLVEKIQLENLVHDKCGQNINREADICGVQMQFSNRKLWRSADCVWCEHIEEEKTTTISFPARNHLGCIFFPLFLLLFKCIRELPEHCHEYCNAVLQPVDHANMRRI